MNNTLRKSAFMIAIACAGSPAAMAQNGNLSDKPVSFTKHVAPIIVTKCGKCHVANSKGRYGIASYDELIDSGSIKAGAPSDSSFIEVIESGEMPKGGLKVTDNELSTLKQWVAEGAKYDGEDSKKPLMKSRDQASNRGGTRGRESGGRSRQSGGGSRLKAVDVNPQSIGEQGIAWYTTWDTALAEAKRSNRPIFFMSAAAQCSGVSGVF